MRNRLYYKNGWIIIDTAKIESAIGPVYETMAMYERSGLDIEHIQTCDLNEARANHRAMVERYGREAAEYYAEQDAKREEQAKKPLTGKYAKLRDDLKAACEAAAWTLNTEDGGTCNFDAPTIDLPRWNAEKIKQAAEEAGVGAFRWRWGGTILGWVFSPRFTGQGNRRTRHAEAMSAELSRRGYDAGMYYQMD